MPAICGQARRWDDIHFIERGYERFVEKLNALGADIQVHYDEEDSGSVRAFSIS